METSDELDDEEVWQIGASPSPRGVRSRGVSSCFLRSRHASIGVMTPPSQGVCYFERDGYYVRDDPAHLEASAWAGKGAKELGLSGPVDPDTFQAILEGWVPALGDLPPRRLENNTGSKPIGSPTWHEAMIGGTDINNRLKALRGDATVQYDMARSVVHEPK